MTDWQVGDLALCVDDGPCKCGCGLPCEGLRGGRAYSVLSVCSELLGVSIKYGNHPDPDPRHKGGWAASERFQKIDKCEDEFTELMRQMKPAPEKVQ